MKTEWRKSQPRQQENRKKKKKKGKIEQNAGSGARASAKNQTKMNSVVCVRMGAE